MTRIIILFLLFSYSCQESKYENNSFNDVGFVEEWSSKQFDDFQMCCEKNDNVNYVKARQERITSLRNRCLEIVKKEGFIFSTGIIEIAEDYSENNFYYTFNLRQTQDNVVTIKFDLSKQKYSLTKSNENQWGSVCYDKSLSCCPYFEGHNPIIAMYSKFRINKKKEIKVKKLCVLFE